MIDIEMITKPLGDPEGCCEILRDFFRTEMKSGSKLPPVIFLSDEGAVRIRKPRDAQKVPEAWWRGAETLVKAYDFAIQILVSHACARNVGDAGGALLEIVPEGYFLWTGTDPVTAVFAHEDWPTSHELLDCIQAFERRRQDDAAVRHELRLKHAA